LTAGVRCTRNLKNWSLFSAGGDAPGPGAVVMVPGPIAPIHPEGKDIHAITLARSSSAWS
jgi:hypothetical protein